MNNKYIIITYTLLYKEGVAQRSEHTLSLAEVDHRDRLAAKQNQ